MKNGAFVIFFISMVMLVSCSQPPSEKVTRYEENYEIIGEEKDALLKDMSETTFEMSDRSNEQAEGLDMPVVEYDQEYSVPEGRYSIYGEPAGNAYIHDEDGYTLFQGNFYNIPSITVDLDESHVLTFDGLDEVFVMPVETEELSPEYLTPGVWHVGTDIKAGFYSVHSLYGIGYLQIFGPNDHHEVYEISHEYEVKVHLEEGQTIKILDLAEVYFTPDD